MMVHTTKFARIVTVLLLIGVFFLPYSPAGKAADLYSPLLPRQRTVTKTIDGVNAIRYADTLIVYTPQAGRTTTGTNEWGNEAVVTAGVVTSIGGNNQFIPADGFVVSAHGAAIAWLQEHMQLGARVTLEGNTLRVTIDAETHQAMALRAMDDAAQRLQQTRPFITADAYNTAADALSAATEYYEAGDAPRAIHRASLARYAAEPSFPVEVRGVWHRPVETSPQQIRKTLDDLQQAGFNALFLETFYTGYAIYPSDIAPQRAQFAGWDPLAYWAEEAATRDIELHLWVHLFHLGQVTVLRHPMWANVQRDGSLEATLEPGLYYGDPGHPEVRAYVMSVLKEMVNNYNVAGLHLDYVRYPNTNDLSNTSGYSLASRQAFEQAHGHDPLKISPQSHPAVWQQWLAWQQNNITSFVDDVQQWVRQQAPHLVLSAAVVPNVQEAIDSKRQNWFAWASDGWIDLLSPMIYSLDDGHVARQIEDMKGRTAQAWFAPGLAPYMGMSPHQTIVQFDAARAVGQPGAVLFALHSVKTEHLDALGQGMFSSPAATPWQRERAIGAFAQWVEEGLPRWVAEDVVPADTALALDELATTMLAWHATPQDERDAIPAHWAETLRDASQQLDTPWLRTGASPLRNQLLIMVDVLEK